MREYRNYIFDLYGTLLDIETDEQQSSLWEYMAQIYHCYGCEWEGQDLKAAYQKMVDEEERVLRQKTGYAYPEIQLERVFARLLLEAPDWHSCEARIVGESVEVLRANAHREREIVLERMMEGGWCFWIASQFRVYSRKRMALYPNTIQVLQRLRAEGKGIYLLSNAQRSFTMPELEITGLLPYLDKVYISSDAGMKKPQPEYMQKLLSEQKLEPEECVMVGNEMASDIAVAMACGLDSIYLNTFAFERSELERQRQEIVGCVEVTREVEWKVILSGDIGELCPS